jgi:hypothetical protein
LDVATAVYLTADGWTLLNHNSLLAITAHFLEETNMCSTLLGCVEFNEKHTAAKVADMLHETARQWKIEYKIVRLLQTMLLILFPLSISVNGFIYLAMLTLLI